MIRSGEWVVPHYNGEIYIEKPPLLFWLMAIPSWFYGSVTPLIARLPSALSAWAGVLILFLWGRRVYGTVQAGIISGGLCLMSFQYFFEARNPKTDMLFCLMIVLSLYFFYLGYDTNRRKSYLFYGLSFFSHGAGYIDKRPGRNRYPDSDRGRIPSQRKAVQDPREQGISRRATLFWPSPCSPGWHSLSKTWDGRRVLPW